MTCLGIVHPSSFRLRPSLKTKAEGPLRSKRAGPLCERLTNASCIAAPGGVRRFLFSVATFSPVAYLGLRSLPDRGAAYEPSRAGRSELQDGYRPRKEDLVVAGLPTAPLLNLPAG